MSVQAGVVPILGMTSSYVVRTCVNRDCGQKFTDAFLSKAKAYDLKNTGKSTTRLSSLEEFNIIIK